MQRKTQISLCIRIWIVSLLCALWKAKYPEHLQVASKDTDQTALMRSLIWVFGLARGGSAIGFHLLWHTIELAMSTRLCLSYELILFLCFCFDALTELGAFTRTEFLCITVYRVASGPRMKSASCKSALTPPPPSPPRWFILLTVQRRWSRC